MPGLFLPLIAALLCQGCSDLATDQALSPTYTPPRLQISENHRPDINEKSKQPTSTRPASLLPTTPPTLAPTPIRFAFPTLAVEPITIWRPPLYPTPWEPTPNDHFYFSRPIGANEINWPLANYRYGGTFIESFIHTGIDIPAPTGTPVMAAGSGTVIWAGFGLFFQMEKYSDPYGLAVAIKHDFGYQGKGLYTIYGHLNSISAESGQAVQAGDVIGVVGETGKTTGPHLHFEVRIGENSFYVTRNPELWLTPPQGWGLIAGRIMETNGEPLGKHTINVRKLASNLHWSVITYAGVGVNSDPYYKENMVMGDLPAGDYLVWTEYEGSTYSIQVSIQPGLVTYLRFVGNLGFNKRPPTNPSAEFIPPDQLQLPIP